MARAALLVLRRARPAARHTDLDGGARDGGDYGDGGTPAATRPSAPARGRASAALTRDDLAGSPFHGEGHRKVCARLRLAGHPVFARQVLRVMRGAQLLSPHRARQGAVRAHDGRIVTDAPDVMWGTDGMRVETVEGWVWIFMAVEHWNGEVMGWHVAQKGDRFAALEPLRQGLVRLGRGVGRWGAVAADESWDAVHLRALPERVEVLVAHA